MLIAIEDGKFDQLPGPAYAVGFVRAYSTYLGLDAEALVLRFKAETAEMAGKPDLNFPLPLGDRRVPTGPILIICVLLAVLTYGGWYYYFGGRDQMTAFVPGVPERLHNLLAPQPASPPQVPVSAPVIAPPVTPVSPAEAAPTTTAAAPQDSDGTPPVESRSVTPLVAPNPPALPDIAAPKPVDPEKAPPEGSYGSPENDSRVVLHATADSWVEVRDGHSNLLFSRVLKPGERYNAPNEPGLTLIAGNAGGLNITVDGTNIPAIGEIGHVARNVSLDPDRLLGAHAHAN